MNNIRKLILSLLTLLPISSIAFAAEHNLKVENQPQDMKAIEKEFEQVLRDNKLPPKYYLFLNNHQIEITELLQSSEFKAHKKRLLDEYIRDYKNPYLNSAGALSVF